MAFSIRKMFSNINYFKKSDSSPSHRGESHTSPDSTIYDAGENINFIDIESIEPDTTTFSNRSTSLKLPKSVMSFTAKKGSLSDTDLLKINPDERRGRRDKRQSKKLKLDVKRANKSMSEALDAHSQSYPNKNIENTPTYVHLDCKSSEIFSEKLRDFDFNKSFDIFDAMSEGRPSTANDDYDVESLSEHTDSEVSLEASKAEEKVEIKMCRKVSQTASNVSINEIQVRSTTPESFGDVELDKNEEERVTLLLNYQMRFEKLERLLKKLLTEFQFHIEVSKVFNCKSVVTTLPGSDYSNIKMFEELTHVDAISRCVSPTGSWNVILEKEDAITKLKLRRQLNSIKNNIEEFVNSYLKSQESSDVEESNANLALKKPLRKSLTFDLSNINKHKKQIRINRKKKNKRYFEYPDYRVALCNLFDVEIDEEHVLDDQQCTCLCRYHRSPSPSSEQTDSGLNAKEDERSQSITSSLGNFSLDSSTLTAFSESLDQIISYGSFHDTSLYSSLLQKASVERITFYVQVHSIQLNSEPNTSEFEVKNVITFFCPSCNISEKEEHALLGHILGQYHCERIHFLYKTAYIKRCMAESREIQPSTVLNPMTMYRDDNKIVCFGDAKYACTLCFESSITGESILMAHCADPTHIERREMLFDMIE